MTIFDIISRIIPGIMSILNFIYQVYKDRKKEK